MHTYRAALVGLTGIGAARPAPGAFPPPMPRSHASAYHQHPRTELVAVCDLDPAMLEQFRRTWQEVWPQMRYYADYEQMLDEVQPELVSIATSDHAHAALTVAAAQCASCRAILCEKPIATTLADADRMIAACEENHTLLSIEHTRRWNPLFVAARQLVRSGELGALRTLTAELFSRRAMLFRNGTHAIDLFNFFAESAPLWVWAELEPGFGDYVEYQGDGGRDPDAEPYASAYVRYDGGMRAFFNSYKIPFPGFKFILTCEEGRLELSDHHGRLVRGRSHYEWAESVLHVEGAVYAYQLGAVAELVQVLEEGGELVSPPRQARQALEIILGMLRSHAQGNERVDLPLD